MKIKTAYRTNSQAQFPAEKIAEEIPPSEKIDINSEPAADAVTVHHEPDAPPSVAVAEAMQEAAKADEATDRLRKQLDDIRRSEEIQRQHAERQHQHTQQLNQLAEFAASEAEKQGLQRGSHDHLSAAREIFQNYLAHLQAQAQAATAAQHAAVNPAPAPQPFPRSSPAPLPPEPPSSVSHFSAPVSRGEVGNYHREPSPSSVRLSPEEKQIAAISGISETEYAKNKLRLAREVHNNERQR